MSKKGKFLPCLATVKFFLNVIKKYGEAGINHNPKFIHRTIVNYRRRIK